MTNTHRDSHSRAPHQTKVASIGSADQRGDAIICALRRTFFLSKAALGAFIRSGTGRGPIVISAAGGGDAQRLCASSMANPSQLTACMRSNASKVSAGCRTAMGMGGGKKRRRADFASGAGRLHRSAGSERRLLVGSIDHLHTAVLGREGVGWVFKLLEAVTNRDKIARINPVLFCKKLLHGICSPLR
jgi:hypothetical protein